MYITSLDKHYNLIEFDLYATENGSGATYVLDLLIDCLVDEFEPMDEMVVTEGEKSYEFNGFQLNEWYEENGKVRVVYVK